MKKSYHNRLREDIFRVIYLSKGQSLYVKHQYRRALSQLGRKESIRN